MNIVSSDKVSFQPKLLEQTQKISSCTPIKKVIAVAVTIISGFGIAFSIAVAMGSSAGASAATLPIALVVGTTALIAGLIACLILKRFSISTIEPKKELTSVESKPSEDKINCFYKQYLVGQEDQIEEIVEALSSRFGKNLDSIKPQSDEELNQILQFIDQTKAALTDFENILKNVKDQSKADLYFDDASIEKKFQIKSTLQHLSEQQQRTRRESLQKIINQAYLNHELKQKGKLVNGNEDEINLLKALNFKVGVNSDYKNKELVYNVLRDVVTNQLKSESQPLELIKESLKLCALKARLSTAGLKTPLQIEKFKITLPLYVENKNELMDSIEDIHLKLPENFPLQADSIGMRRLVKYLNFYKAANVDLTLKEFFGNQKNIVRLFNDEEYGKKEFENHLSLALDKNRNLLERDELLEKCPIIHVYPYVSKRIEHYNKWGKYFKVEMAQGFEDENEALGNGVCAGFSQRICFEAQQKPDITPEELVPSIKITSRDRFFQGTLGTNWNKLPEPGSKSPYLVHNKGYEEEEILVSEFNKIDPVLEEGFKLSAEALKASAGWTQLRLIGACHRILARWDIERNRYWALDSNEGLLCFEGPQIKPEEAQKLCIDYLNDLFKLNYPDLKEIKYVQLVKTT